MQIIQLARYSILSLLIDRVFWWGYTFFSKVVVETGVGIGPTLVRIHPHPGRYQRPTFPIGHPVHCYMSCTAQPCRTSFTSFCAHQEPSLHALESREMALVVIAPYDGERVVEAMYSHCRKSPACKLPPDLSYSFDGMDPLAAIT
jgi:hypothetical protein